MVNDGRPSPPELGWVKMGNVAFLESSIKLMRSTNYVYVLTCDEPLHYGLGESRVAYIGESSSSAGEAFSAVGEIAAWRVPSLERGGNLSVHGIAVPGGIDSDSLEAAMLAAFKQRYGALPQGNKQSGNFEAESVRVVQERAGLSLAVLSQVLGQLG